MIRRMLLGVVVLCLMGAATGADEPKREEAATKVAEAWLKLTDDGKHEESWRDAAENFRAAVTREQWQQALKAARAPLGATKSRKVKSATHKTSLPGAPDGDYVVIEFESSFENKAEAVETVTPMLDKDGVWRVSGYFIR